MTDEELTNELNNRKAEIVHFSHHANMREGGVFPADLEGAITNHCQWTLSCCVIWPSHKMNLPGSVGVIFKPLAKHVISVLNDDSGSTTLPNGEELSGGESLNKQNFENSFRVAPDCYNEWRVKGAEVFGIYVDNPSLIYVKQEFQMPWGEIEILISPVSLEFVKSCFPGRKIYTMQPSGLIDI